jgi:hypothetical protein
MRIEWHVDLYKMQLMDFNFFRIKPEDVFDKDIAE